MCSPGIRVDDDIVRAFDELDVAAAGDRGVAETAEEAHACSLVNVPLLPSFLFRQPPDDHGFLLQV